MAGALPKIEAFGRLRFWRQCLATAGHARMLAHTPDCLVSVMSDAGERGLTAVTTLLDAQGELVAHLHLDLEWLAQHLQPYDSLTSGVDQLLH